MTRNLRKSKILIEFNRSSKYSGAVEIGLENNNSTKNTNEISVYRRITVSFTSKAPRRSRSRERDSTFVKMASVVVEKFSPKFGYRKDLRPELIIWSNVFSINSERYFQVYGEGF